ncbi:conserved domain protein [Trichinella spiralis]|uniref:hypothetical protein n=1 Tax=Trichinella spiralis TaxID=6334 RepID=UPI0001EFEFF3|nr:conserved domain protein [Trichinella spiralis]
MFTWQLWRYSQPVPLGGGRRKTRSSCRSGSESRRRNGHHWLQMGLWMKSLRSQRGRIVLQEGTACRTWEIPDKGESRLLPVILRRNIPEILTAIHNQRTGGYLGVAETPVKVRQRY